MKFHFLIILPIAAMILIAGSLYAQELVVDGHFDTGGEAYAVAVSENFIYVADGTNGLVVLARDDEWNIEEVGHFDTDGEAYGVTLYGDFIYVADGENGLIIFESDEEGNLEVVNDFDTDGDAFSVIVDENYIYIADGENGIVVLAEDGDGNLIQVNQWNHPNDMADGVAYYGLLVEGDGYLADGENGFVILTAGDDGGIVVDKHWQHPENVEGEAFGVDVSDERIYLADGQNGLVILTADDDGELVMDNHWQHPNNVDGEAIRVMVVGDKIYVADAVNGLVILAEDNEGNLVVDNHWQHPENIDGETVGVTVVEDEDDVRIYLADGDNGLVVLEQSRELEVAFTRGWNMISINVEPPGEFWEREEGPDIVLMTEQLRIDEDSHHLILMKDEQGRFYSPAFNYNNIPYWNLNEGYLVKVDEDVESTWQGTSIAPDDDIILAPGWNMIAYYPDYELDASAPDFYVLSPIIDHVILAKDNLGDFMLPSFNFSNMTPWRETQGYQVKIESDEPIVLNYPPEQDENFICIEANMSTGSHWTPPPTTGANMSILITFSENAASMEDEVAAFSPAGLLVGAGTVGGDGVCGLAVWGDDPSTETTEGLKDGEAFGLRLWDVNLKTEAELCVESVRAGSGLVYKTDDFTVLEASADFAAPVEFYLSQNYPNPFNAVTSLAYGLTETAHVSIRVYDTTGRLIAELVDDKKQAGYHSVTWNAGTASSGIYVLQMEAGGFSRIQKAILVK